MDYTTILGLVAGVLTTIAFLPQVIKIWKSKSTKDISLGMYVIFITGTVFWFVYGIALRQLPIILVNVVMIVLASIILALKIKYK